MYTYFVTRPLILNGHNQTKRFNAVSDATQPSMQQIYLAAQLELENVRAALQMRYPTEPLETLLRFLSPDALLETAGMPRRLGIQALSNPDDASSAEPCLIAQLRELRHRQPARQQYRLLLINAFGSNLGDCLIGLSAFRHVLAVLRAELPEVSVDVLLGWQADDSLQSLFRDVDGIDKVLTQGPTLAALTRYQAVFDCSDLLLLPRYGTLPLVDWYLWWLGLTPDSIAATDKRNRIALSKIEERAMRALLTGEGPHILINPKSSVELRSMPHAAYLRLVNHLLAVLPEARLLLLQPLSIDHPRAVDVSSSVHSVERLAAIVAHVDALIGVDTYTLHLADATDTPAVTLFTSVSPDLYPYYPLSQSLLLPNAHDLPAWGKAKVSNEIWQDIRSSYETAWLTLDLDHLTQALRHVMADKAKQAEAFACRRSPIPYTPLAKTRVQTQGNLNLAIPRLQREDPLSAVLNQTLLNIAGQVLRIGDCVVHLATGAGELTLALATMIGMHGRLVAFEPRRQLHQQLCANLANAGVEHVETHAVMPDGDNYAVRDIYPLHVTDDYLPLQMSNAAEPEAVVCWPLDLLNLQSCRLLLVCSPLPVLSVLQSARETLLRLKPVILTGVLALDTTAELEMYLADLGYRVRILELGNPQAPDVSPLYGIVVANISDETSVR